MTREEAIKFMQEKKNPCIADEDLPEDAELSFFIVRRVRDLCRTTFKNTKTVRPLKLT